MSTLREKVNQLNKIMSFGYANDSMKQSIEAELPSNMELVFNNVTNKYELKEKEIKTMNKRDERMNTLTNAGIETGKYFTVQLPEGLPAGASVSLVINENGQPVFMQKPSEDPILNQIIEDGYVRNSKLHRRFIMAQTFKLLNYKSYNGRETGWEAAVRNNYGYHYQFDMMLDEIWVISRLETKDAETFKERTSFFNYGVVATVCKDYMKDLKAHIAKLPKHNCKGVPYKRLNGRYGNVFESDLQKKVYTPMEYSIMDMASARNYYELFRELRKFMNLMIKLPYQTAKSKTWVDAFKGAGAYFTLKNLTMFHNCKIMDEKYNGWRQPRTITTYAAGIEATNFVKSKLDEYKGEGWRYLAMLRKCIADNDFSFEERMKEVYNK